MKTSDFPSAAPLAGSEPAGVVQDETNVQVSVEAISYVVPLLPAVKVGYNAYTNGFSSIAIGGGECVATGSTSSMAIGAGALTLGSLPLNIGSPAYTTGAYAVSIGKYNVIGGSPRNVTVLGAGNECDAGSSYITSIGAGNSAASQNQVAIGHEIRNDDAENSVLIGFGNGFNTVAPYDCVIIGNPYTGCYGPYCVVIGQSSSVVFRGVTVGFYSGLGRVPYDAAGESSIAIGCHAYIPRGTSIGIGYNTLSVYAGVALGANLGVDGESVATGYNTSVVGTRAVAIGHSLYAAGNSVALGNQAHAYQSYSTVFGSEISDPAIGGSFVNAGVPISSPLRPVVFHQKFIGSTISPKGATAAWGNGFYTATVTWGTTGPVGNSITLAVADNEADSPLALSIADNTVAILLATDDSSTNTLANIADLFPSDGFTFSYTNGFGASVVSTPFSESFSGGVDGSPTTVLTCDGNGPTINNLPVLYNNSLATVTGIVTGATPTLLSEGSGDAATFTLAPVMVVKREVSYSFIGTPTFTITNNTDGASDWDVPVFATAEDATLLEITVTNTDADVNWMAHLIFEASQDE